MVAPIFCVEKSSTSLSLHENHGHDQERVPEEYRSSANALYCLGLLAQCRCVLLDRRRRGPADSVHDCPPVRRNMHPAVLDVDNTTLWGCLSNLVPRNFAAEHRHHWISNNGNNRDDRLFPIIDIMQSLLAYKSMQHAVITAAIKTKTKINCFILLRSAGRRERLCRSMCIKNRQNVFGPPRV
jgi:hypothetical protein